MIQPRTSLSQPLEYLTLPGGGARATERRVASRVRRSQGGVLVLALIAVMAVTAMGAVALQISVRTARQESQAVQHKQAFYLAEAGLAEAFTGLGIGKTGNVGSEAAPAVYGDGLFWVEAETAAGGSLVRLESTGMWGGGRATLALVAQGTVESVAALGLFSLDAIALSPGVLVDSFDSTAGDYAGQVDTPSNFNALLGSNLGVALSSGEVRGDVMTGPGATFELGTATLTGSVQPLPQPAVVPPIDVPSVGPTIDLVHADPAPLVLAAGEHGYGQLELAEGTTTLVQGPSTLVVQDLVLRSGATLELDSTDGLIEIFVAGMLDFEEGSTVVTPLEDPASVVLQLALPEEQRAGLRSQSDFYGFLYSPDAAVDLGADFELFGGVVAKAFGLEAGGALHYDVSIGAKLMTLPNRVSWRLVEIPSSVAGSGMDPFKTLGLDPAVLGKPAAAHADQQLTLEYLDELGFATTYDGLESAFDWTGVSAVVCVARDGKAVTAPSEWISVDGAKEGPEAIDTPLDAAQQAILDGILDGSMSTADIKAAILKEQPVHDDVLLAALKRQPPMPHDDIKPVVAAHSPFDAAHNPDGIAGGAPLADELLYATVAPDGPTIDDLADLLIANSPLSSDVLQAVIDKVPPLKAADLDAVLAAQ